MDVDSSEGDSSEGGVVDVDSSEGGVVGEDSFVGGVICVNLDTVCVWVLAGCCVF